MNRFTFIKKPMFGQLKSNKFYLLTTAIFLAVFLFSGCANNEIKPTDPIKEVSASQESILLSSEENIVEQPIIEIKEEIKNEEINFETVNQNDSTLEQDQTKIKQEGIKGSKELKYKITYTDGKETSRELISEKIEIQPVNKIVLIGTKEKAIIKTTTCGSDSYVNVDGDCIKRPSSNPSGASAKCRDGSYSYSAHRQGTCSGHGGVAQWL